MKTTPATRRLLSVSDAAEYLGLSKDTVYRLVERGDLAVVRTQTHFLMRTGRDQTVRPFRKTGRLLFLPRDLDAWIEANRVPARHEQGDQAERTDPLPLPKKLRFG